MSKIDIHKDEKEAEAIIKRAMKSQPHDIEVPKEKKSIVFRAITEIKNHLKTDKGHITLKEVRKKVDAKQISNEEMGVIINALDEDGHIHYDPQTERIYM